MMAQASVTRRYRFCAAHRLHTDYLSSEDNLAIFGKCNNPNGHGHNYVVLVTVKSIALTATGGGVDLDLLDRTVADQVVTRFDHHDLNQDPEFADRTTTGENLVLLIWDLLVKCLPAGQLEKVGLIETRDNYFEYAGGIGNVE
ncbi:MAG TPA: 6-carboxytetrahydropterin synthase [Nitrospiraceae bacterium]|nr:6-carboxytetrahydropterin synthase [Nitrospiraceae bacterium]